jgi:hypothetical protein
MYKRLKAKKPVNLYSTHQVNKLGELEPHLDGDLIRVVGHRPDQPVVVAQQVVVQPLGVRIARRQRQQQQEQQQQAVV